MYLGQCNTEKYFYLGQYRNNSVWDRKILLFKAMKDRKVLLFGTAQEEQEKHLRLGPPVSAPSPAVAPQTGTSPLWS